ncbi:MAG: 8-oxoguanine DNA glycosylase, partial [Candidatus Thorarchaeota archaeon]
IPSIRRTVQMLREHYGPRYKFRGKTYYGFPEPENLAGADVEVLRRIGLDWRAEFVVSSSRSIASGDVTEEQLRGLSYEEAHSLLKTLYGVGDKVSDCVCLFSLGFLEAFPIDVWIERVIQDNYGILASAKAYAKKSQLAREYFGRYAGYAQEYLYYYSRNNMARTRGS